MNKKIFIKFNVNYHVWVKLTEKGVETLLKHRNKYAEQVGAVTMDDILKWYSVTEDGYYQFQMHEFMQIFGDGVVFGTEFETNLYFDPAELLVPVLEEPEPVHTDKYITVSIPTCTKHGERLNWWNPGDVPKIILKMESENIGYDFHQFVTSPGNGGHGEYAIMKLKYR